MLQIFGETIEGILELNVAQLFADSRDWPHLCDRSDREGRLEDLELRLRGLEISERTFVTHSSGLKETLLKIEALGVDLCLDEIGTKYSSLGNLSGLPFTTHKIDRGFVSQLSSEGGTGTVEAVLALIRQMGLTPVVEGVETEDQMADLRRIGCDIAQGYLFSAAVDVEKAFDLLKLGQLLPLAAERGV